MPNVFPNSARAAWLLRNAQPRHRARVAVSSETRELRLLAKELARDLRSAPMEHLVEVAKVLGRTTRWIEMVRMEARRPGLVGRDIIRATR